MGTFWHVIVVILLGGLMLALFAGIVCPWGGMIAEGAFEFGGAVISAVSLVLMAIYISILINSGVFKSDDSTHCGPGTHYVTLRIDHGDSHTWMCTT